MRLQFSPRTRLAWRTAVAAPLAALLVLVLLVAACGGTDSPPEVVIVTATHTPAPVVVVITATSTPTPDTGGPDTTPSLTPEQPTKSVGPAGGEPTATLRSATKATLPPPPTETPGSQEPAASPTPKPTSAPQASLASYRVAYSNFYGGDRHDEYKYGAWMMRGDGQQAGELLHPAFEPSFSADGKQLAFYRPWIGLWIYNFDDKSKTPVVEAPYAEFGSFSPDGKKLVFHEWNEVIWAGDVYLYVVNTDGSGRTRLQQGIRPAWSPKGGLIAFDTCRDTSCGIYVVQPNGEGFRQITSDAGGGAAWSPNGKRIAYHSGADGDNEIYVVNLDGTGRKQLTHNTGHDALPAFSPDGQYIYFISDQNGTGWAVRAMRADGSGVKTLHSFDIIAGKDYHFSRLWVTWW